MHYTTLTALTFDAKQTLAKGPIALLLVEDDILVSSTITHLQNCGFKSIIAFAKPEIALPDYIHRVDYDLLPEDALPTIVNAVVAAAPDIWFHYCYNGEYLYYPFSESRSIGEMIAFSMEERRFSIMTYVVDLYAGDLEKNPVAVSLEDAHLDRTGYYSLGRKDELGGFYENQLEFFGGLRWRFEEHVPLERRRIDRISLFRAQPGLQMLPDRRFNIDVYNTYSCPWHHSMTAATCSFRTAKALKSNPGSRDEIRTFQWENSVKFEWHSQQLADLGMIEPGQWF